MVQHGLGGKARSCSGTGRKRGDDEGGPRCPGLRWL